MLFENGDGLGRSFHLMRFKNSLDRVADLVLNQLVKSLVRHWVDCVELGVVNEEILEFGDY